MNIDFNKNEDAMKLMLSQLKQQMDKIEEGGGKQAIQKQREKNKLTARERIDYLKDTDNDGVADIRKVVLTGFFATQTAQIRMSHPTLGLDGWVYVTAGLNGGNEVRDGERGKHSQRRFGADAGDARQENKRVFFLLRAETE